MIPRRHFKRFLAAYLGLAACGFDLAVVVDDTVHLVMVDGAWRWIPPQRRYERYRDNACGGGGPPPQVAS
jgi:hypothetical protein